MLAAAAGELNSEIADRLQMTRAAVGKWRRRFVQHRIGGLHDALRPGKPRTVGDEHVADLINKTLYQTGQRLDALGCARDRSGNCDFAHQRASLLQAAGPAAASQRALERTQPMLPIGLGYVEGVTHDYVRHGTTTLFAALNVLNGAVLATCKPRHRHQEFLSFLGEIDKSVPAELDIHCIVDNYASHKHPKVKAWLA